MLEDEEELDLLAHAATLFANANAPAAVLQALAKPGGGVRGIATRDTLRRLVSRAWHDSMRTRSTAPRGPSSSLSLAAMLCAASELDADATIVSLDGWSA